MAGDDSRCVAVCEARRGVVCGNGTRGYVSYGWFGAFYHLDYALVGTDGGNCRGFGYNNLG